MRKLSSAMATRIAIAYSGWFVEAVEADEREAVRGDRVEDRAKLRLIRNGHADRRPTVVRVEVQTRERRHMLRRELTLDNDHVRTALALASHAAPSGRCS